MAEPGGRLLAVDACRGVAAMAVVLHHVQHNTVLEVALRASYPDVIDRILQFGARGVEVFFVLSGFVLAYSVRDLPLTLRNAGRFVMRRQLRLDPPYWVTLVLATAMIVAERTVGLETPVPGLVDVLRNVVYIPGRQGELIVGVAWTLLVEIQFYLVLIALLLSLHAFKRSTAQRQGWPSMLPFALFVTGVASALFHTQKTSTLLFAPFWVYFASGALLCLAWQKECGWSWSLGLATFNVAIAVPSGPSLEFAAFGAASVIVLLVGVVLRPSWSVWRSRPLQYLGSRSYSIYLVHLPVLTVVMRGGYKLTGESRPGAVVWAALAVAASLVTAELMHRFVERPSLRLAAGAKRDGWAGVRAEALAFLPARRANVPNLETPTS